MAKKHLTITKSLVVFSLILVAFSATKLAWSAYSELYFGSPEENLIVGSEFEVKVLLFTDQPLNAYSLNFLYPAHLMELVEFNDVNSIIDIWQTQPQVTPNGEVSLKGGSLKPVNRAEGLITTVKFKAVEVGKGEMRFENSNVYLANGKGTKYPPGTKSLSIEIFDAESIGGGVPLKKPKETDTLPPRIEHLSVIKDPLNADQKLLSFVVKDDKSGINEVYFQTRRWLWWNKERPALNPTAIGSNVWSVNFKVVDNQGNVSRYVIRDWEVFLKQVVPLLVVLLSIAVLAIHNRRKIKKL